MYDNAWGESIDLWLRHLRDLDLIPGSATDSQCSFPQGIWFSLLWFPTSKMELTLPCLQGGVRTNTLMIVRHLDIAAVEAIEILRYTHLLCAVQKRQCY